MGTTPASPFVANWPWVSLRVPRTTSVKVDASPIAESKSETAYWYLKVRMYVSALFSANSYRILVSYLHGWIAGSLQTWVRTVWAFRAWSSS